MGARSAQRVFSKPVAPIRLHAPECPVWPGYGTVSVGESTADLRQSNRTEGRRAAPALVASCT
jgi:hypothetical protein